MRHNLLRLLVALALVVLCPVGYSAESLNPCLAEATNISLYINVSKDLAAIDITEESVAKQVELICRRNKLPVDRKETYYGLVVSVTGYSVAGQSGGKGLGYVAFVQVYYQQPVATVVGRVPSPPATTWQVAGELLSGPSAQRMRENIRNSIEEQTEAFAVSWLFNHP